MLESTKVAEKQVVRSAVSRRRNVGVIRFGSKRGTPKRARIAGDALMAAASDRNAGTLRRGIAVIETLSSSDCVGRGGYTMTEIAEAIDADKSQTTRVLQVLAEYGYVVRDASSRRFTLGWRLYARAVRAVDRKFIEVAAAKLGRLVTRFSEPTHLAVLHGPNVFTVWAEKPQRDLQPVVAIGRTRAASYSATGRCLLVDHDLDALRERFGDAPLPQPTPTAPGSVDELYERLRAVVGQGYAIVEGESEPHLVSIAAPVRNALDTVQYAIGMAGPDFRIDQDRAACIEGVVAAAKLMEAYLSGDDAALTSSKEIRDFEVLTD